MPAITLQEAQARLPEIIAKLGPGETIAIVEDNRTIATIIAPEPPKGIPILGRGIGKMTIVSDDEEHLELFKEYMP